MNSKVANVFEDRLADVWICQMEQYREYDKFIKCSKCELRHGAEDAPQLQMVPVGVFMESIHSVGKRKIILRGEELPC